MFNISAKRHNHKLTLLCFTAAAKILTGAVAKAASFALAHVVQRDSGGGQPARSRFLTLLGSRHQARRLGSGILHRLDQLPGVIRN